MLREIAFFNGNLALAAGLPASADRLQFHTQPSGRFQQKGARRNFASQSGRHENKTAVGGTGFAHRFSSHWLEPLVSGDP
jgi:hypothetical protein